MATCVSSSITTSRLTRSRDHTSRGWRVAKLRKLLGHRSTNNKPVEDSNGCWNASGVINSDTSVCLPRRLGSPKVGLLNVKTSKSLAGSSSSVMERGIRKTLSRWGGFTVTSPAKALRFMDGMKSWSKGPWTPGPMMAVWPSSLTDMIWPSKPSSHKSWPSWRKSCHTSVAIPCGFWENRVLGKHLWPESSLWCFPAIMVDVANFERRQSSISSGESSSTNIRHASLTTARAATKRSRRRKLFLTWEIPRQSWKKGPVISDIKNHVSLL